MKLQVPPISHMTTKQGTLSVRKSSRGNSFVLKTHQPRRGRFEANNKQFEKFDIVSNPRFAVCTVPISLDLAQITQATYLCTRAAQATKYNASHAGANTALRFQCLDINHGPNNRLPPGPDHAASNSPRSSYRSHTCFQPS
jgi:hypothetical protein